MLELVFARLWEATVITFKLFGLIFKGLRGLIRMITNRKSPQVQSSYKEENEQGKSE